MLLHQDKPSGCFIGSEKYNDAAELDANLPEKTLLSRLIKLYNEATSWYTRQQIMSELLSFIPGLTKWRIDEARKHALVTSPGQFIGPPVLHQCRLHPVKVDHFLDFIASPTFLQDVAYGTKTLKLSSGQKIEIPNAVRTVVVSRLILLYQSYVTLHRKTVNKVNTCTWHVCTLK